MALITEDDIRKKIGKNPTNYPKEFYIEKGSILTPSAKSYLTEKGITVQYGTEVRVVAALESTEQTPEKEQLIYETLFGASLKEKPEHMTHLRGNILVFKDHKRIVLRGKLDSLEAKLIEVQLTALKNNLAKLVDELEEVLFFIRLLMRYEVSGEPVGEFRVIGLDEKALRDQSHHPSKYFGMKHFLPTYKMGEIIAGLNSLRTLTREVEIAAYEAFKGPYGEVEREDIIRAYNRLSSLFWIMMFKVKANQYE